MSNMTLGMVSEICRKRHMPGAFVEVNVETDKAQIHNPAAKFNGQTFRIETRHQPNPHVKPQFTLEGCVSEYGKPYWFMEEDLILL